MFAEHICRCVQTSLATGVSNFIKPVTKNLFWAQYLWTSLHVSQPLLRPRQNCCCMMRGRERETSMAVLSSSLSVCKMPRGARQRMAEDGDFNVAALWLAFKIAPSSEPQWEGWREGERLGCNSIDIWNLRLKFRQGLMTRLGRCRIEKWLRCMLRPSKMSIELHLWLLSSLPFLLSYLFSPFRLPAMQPARHPINSVSEQEEVLHDQDNHLTRAHFQP